MTRGVKLWWRKTLFIALSLMGLVWLVRRLAGMELSQADSTMSVVGGMSGVLGLLYTWYHGRTLSAPNQPQFDLVGHLLHLEKGLPPALGDVDLGALGVKASIGSDTDGPTRYVARDGQDELEWAVAAGGMVLLHGPAAAGKTRLAAEVLRRLRPHHQLWVPAGPGSLRAVLDGGHDVRDVVVWLDDLERYLGRNGMDLALLQRLCPPGRSDVVVVATIRNDELTLLDTAVTVSRTEREKAGTHRPGVELVQNLAGRRRIPVAARLSGTEQARAIAVQNSAGGDRRVKDAAASQVGFGEYLVAGPAMMARWAIGEGPLHDFGQALISAAVDCRRAGFHRPLNTAQLALLAHGYVSEARRNRTDLPNIANALKWASQPVLGASSCLIPHREGHTATDYLLDRVHIAPSPLAGKEIAAQVWPTILLAATDDEAFFIGAMANENGLTAITELAWEQAAHNGHDTAMHALGSLLRERDDLDGAELWLEKAAEAGIASAMYKLVLLLRQKNQRDRAEHWLKEAAAAGNAVAMTDYGLQLFLEQDDLDAAKPWLRKAAEAGETTAMACIGLLLRTQGDLDGAEFWYRKGTEAGDTIAMMALGLELFEQGDLAEAAPLLQTAAESANNGFTMTVLGHLLRQQHDLAGAESWYRKGAEAGDDEAMCGLALLLHKRGDPDGAESWMLKAAEAGNTSAAASLEVLRHGRAAQGAPPDPVHGHAQLDL
ncbi:hypothetical protein R8Z50_11160 [Longispora sp. K20-0274]|uniref:tetratricopeptide repeat protein n=1 Tax=Longispora sp. K20-0274 TaxID=3088255 RepID=UPI00399C44B7